MSIVVLSKEEKKLVKSWGFAQCPKMTTANRRCTLHINRVVELGNGNSIFVCDVHARHIANICHAELFQQEFIATSKLNSVSRETWQL